MTFQPNQNLYGVGIGSTVGKGPSYPHYDARAPATTDVLYYLGQEWVWPNNGIWFLIGLSTAGAVTTANWQQAVSSSGDILAIVGTNNQVAASTSSGTSTLSLPSSVITPGSLATTTTLTGGTGITATTGNITATTGNFVASAAGAGIVLNSGTSSGTTAATLNGRSGQITITTPSIAAGAQFTFTITNSSVTASTTQVGYWLTGGTNGSAITIQSVTNSAGQSVVVLNNGTAATANTGSLVLTFLVLN